MASGFGLKGNVGRCYPLFRAFTDCAEKAEKLVDCLDYRDDYMECLHPRREDLHLSKVFYEKKKWAKKWAEQGFEQEPEPGSYVQEESGGHH
eukprot:CAMPEP_0113934514 /NCGR_PEP_ID=MMETSP1339-20121228/1840_1 /TAXON_ID=94617 /ORGANISM="Fibrocapsa japonica" /LENGTH=91 /DNA_ID=CAMNT_0000936357 /DNA_START=52 /DNA_END=327 /DNA_ORIENTATION=+ /assembly_acc=CAM_ASM_000762